MIFTEAERDIALRLFSRVAQETADPQGGVTRGSYSLEETNALQIVAEVAADHGLCARTDRIGNLRLTIDGYGWPDEATVIGSHLDSVPCGGNYDGLAGVVAALLVLQKAKNRDLKKPLVGLGLRGEESAWFGIPHIGAKALFGELTNDDLQRRHRSAPGVCLGNRMSMCATPADMALIARGERLLPTYAAREYWELHIEQGPVLQEQGIAIGCVTGIRGHVRTTNARIFGQAGHSGTTPHRLRKDAVMRFADFMHTMDEQRASLERHGQDCVFTVGVVNTNPQHNAVTAIADEITFSMDFRSMEPKLLHAFVDLARTWGAGGERLVNLGDIQTTQPCQLDEALAERTRRSSATLNISGITMPSGAGHDASVFQKNGVPSGMIFVRNQHGSHNPHEAMDIDDFMKGVEVLWKCVTE